MLRRILLPVALLCAAFSARAETYIGGTLRQIAFVESSGPYIVNQEVLIPRNVEVKVGEGCVFLFQPFTSIKVEGRLIVEGSKAKPVVFTSVYDTAYNKESKQLANPFDWNAIQLEEGSGAILKNFILQYSVFGLRVAHRNITIRNGIFRQNGQCHLMIAEKPEVVIEGSPFTYIPEGSTERYDNSLDGMEGKPANPEKAAKKASPKLIFRWSSLGVGIAAAGAGIMMTVAASQSANDITWLENNEMNYIRQHGPNAYDAELRRRKDSYQNKLISAIILDAAAAAGIAGFTLTFFF